MKTVSGIVVSTHMKSTVVVEIPRLVKHPLYKKVMRRSSKIKAHTDKALAVGQKVTLIATRPISKEVHYKVGEVSEK